MIKSVDVKISGYKSGYIASTELFPHIFIPNVDASSVRLSDSPKLDEENSGANSTWLSYCFGVFSATIKPMMPPAKAKRAMNFHSFRILIAKAMRSISLFLLFISDAVYVNGNHPLQ